MNHFVFRMALVRFFTGQIWRMIAKNHGIIRTEWGSYYRVCGAQSFHESVDEFLCYEERFFAVRWALIPAQRFDGPEKSGVGRLTSCLGLGLIPFRKAYLVVSCWCFVILPCWEITRSGHVPFWVSCSMSARELHVSSLWVSFFIAG